MKPLQLLLLTFISVALSCQSLTDTETMDVSVEISINNVEVLKSNLQLNGNEGNWYYKDSLFNGYAVRYHDNGGLLEKIGFFNGKKEGVAKIWFSNGILKTESYHNQNTLVGSYKTWWDNGVLASEASYEHGRLQGEEKQWYKSGELAKLRNLDKGMEKGLQQAWLKNGKIYVNYEANNGRIFGMRRANSCYALENEVVIRQSKTK